MDNKEMRKEFEIWARENYLKMGVDKEDYINVFNWMQETLQRRREIDLELGEFCKKE